MDSKFNYKENEGKIYKFWEENGYFKAKIDKSKKPFVIVMPPPNVTAKLHIGHALDNTIQDIFIRYNRLKGIPTLWIPGTDHASIATEVKVVEKLRKEGKSKHDIGRDEFLKETWKWKEDYGGQITNQLRKLGCSCDWEKERFTMDSGCSEAVVDVFERLYNEGLIYKGERIVNWCPNCKTSISETEVEYEPQKSFLWHIKYPVENSNEYIVVATTRPETMLGDTAVAVNPSDERYKHLIGKRVCVPLTNRYIEIIADYYVDMEFGTGAVKITPAHDPNDFSVGQRHNLEIIKIMDEDAVMNENALQYNGLTRDDARKKIVHDLKENGYLIKEEPYDHNVGSCYRCHTTIEPYISNQWFVKMKELVKPAIEAVKNGEINFVPKRFEKTYFNWMENIEDWCISRQLWWGHRIPAYYCDKCNKITVSKDDPKTCECGGHLTQDEDTLDTWFSSALWPFSILGWPKKTEEYEYFYPTSMLVTGYDIITFWVSKMIFSGIHYTGKIPFDTVYVHGLVRDSKGRKMSKSLGNGVDPLEIIDKYGTDALRFSLIQNISAGNDIRYMEEKVEAARNFANKLWNAAKFVNMYVNKLNVESVDNFALEDKWILTKLSSLQEKVNKNMDKYEIGIALQNIYDFIWFDFCDWYIEMVKPRLYDENSDTYEAAIWTLNYTLLASIKLLHPFMPYITEEIYSNLKTNFKSIMQEKIDLIDYDFKSESELIESVMQVIKGIRNMRSEEEIEASKKINVKWLVENDEVRNQIQSCVSYMLKLANIGKMEFINKNSINLEDRVLHFNNISIYVDLSSAIDKDAEIQKLTKEIELYNKELNRAKSMLSNQNFVSKAPEKLIEAEKEKATKYTDLIEKVTIRINELSK